MRGRPTVEDGLRVWSLRDGRLLGRFGTNGAGLALMPEQRAVASGSRIYSVPGGAVLRELPPGFEARAASPGGKLLVGDWGE